MAANYFNNSYSTLKTINSFFNIYGIKIKLQLFNCLCFIFLVFTAGAQKNKKTAIEAEGTGKVWSTEKANAWNAAHKWVTGANYIPATAINQLEMWQAETFDPITIDRELGWAEGIGFNTM